MELVTHRSWRKTNMENTLVKEIRNQTEILLRNLEVQIKEAPLDAG